MNKASFLQVCWYKVFPALDGGQKDIAYFFETLSQQADTAIICSNDNESTCKNILNILPKGKLQLLKPGSYQQILKTIKERKVSHVLIEHPYYFLLLFWRKKFGYKLVYSSHNVEYQRLKKLGRWYWPLVKLLEMYLVKRCDFIITKTGEDRQFFEQQWKTKVPLQVFPFCIEKPVGHQSMEKAKSKLGIDLQKKCLLFVANFDYQPNVAAAYHLVNDILPQLVNVVLYIVGKNAQRLTVKNEHLIVLDYVENLEPYFAAADVFVNPITVGAGIQTKNIEAIAYGCAVCCYKGMEAGIAEYLFQKNVFVADSTADMISLLQSTLKPNEVPSNFYADYSWKLNMIKFLQNMSA